MDTVRERVPQHTIEAIDRYVNHHLQPGSFLRAVFENNLRESFARADNDNRNAMFDIVCYCHNRIPNNCWGSPKAVAAWLGETKA